MARDPKRLGRLHRVRHVQEEQARADLQRAEAAARSAEATVDGLRRSLLDIRNELSQPSAWRQPAWVAVNQELERHLSRRIQLAQESADQARSAAEEARDPWQAAHQAAEGLGRLLDRTRDQVAEENEAAQNREMDEVALGRSRRSVESNRDIER